MKEIIESILEEEKKARDKVDKARSDALTIQREAEESARRIEEQSLRSSRKEAADLVTTANQEAEEERERILRSGIKTVKTKTAIPDSLVDELYRILAGETEK